MITKSEATKKFNELKKLGFAVYNFNSQRSMPTGAVGFPDRVIIGFGYIFFIEEKWGKDKMSEAQETFRSKIRMVEGMTAGQVRYYLVNESNFDGIYRTIENAATKKKL